VLAARHQAQIAGDQLMPGRERRSPADRFIGMKIRERRMTLGLTMRQFRELVGKTYQQVYKYERGINGISAGQLYELAQGSGTPVEYFFEGLEMIEPQLLPRQSMLIDFMTSFGGIRGEGRKAAISELVRALSRVGRPARRAYRRRAHSQT
jgi:transcriptional regulator with XRE-family HTH domain